MTRRAKQALLDGFPRVLGPPLPLAPTDWSLCAETLELRRLLEDWNVARSRVGRAALRKNGRGLETAAKELADTTLELAQVVTCLTEFDAPQAFDGHTLLEEIRVRSLGCLDGREDGSAIELRGLPLMADGSAEAEPSVDPYLVFFDLGPEAAVDIKGIRTAAALMSAYSGRTDELTARARRIADRLTDAPLEFMKLLYVARCLLTDSGPVRLRTARLVKEEILRAFEARPDTVGAALNDLRLQSDQSSAGATRITRTMMMINAATDDAERADLMMDWYRQYVEGQLRPWAWTLMRIAGVAGQMPNLGPLRAMLQSCPDPLRQNFVRCMVAMARNAAAHEGWRWNAWTQVIETDAGEITLDDLDAALALAEALVGGAEAGWSAALAESPRLTAAMSHGGPDPVAIRSRTVTGFFALNGLQVAGSRMAGTAFEVTLAEFEPSRVNVCFGAFLRSAQVLREADSFRLCVAGVKQPVLDIPRAPVAESYSLWTQADQWFGQMPTSVVLPINTAARLAVESPDVAGRASARLALDDVMHAFDAGGAGLSGREEALVHLWRRLYVAASGARHSLAIVSPKGSGELAEVVRLLDWAVLAFARGGDHRFNARDRIRRMWSNLSPVSVVPTWHFGGDGFTDRGVGSSASANDPTH
ncbi:hypothetical protein GCM10027269_86450 [Kribbella endophytica]